MQAAQPRAGVGAEFVRQACPDFLVLPQRVGRTSVEEQRFDPLGRRPFVAAAGDGPGEHGGVGAGAQPEVVAVQHRRVAPALQFPADAVDPR